MIVITYDDNYKYPRDEFYQMMTQAMTQLKNTFKDEEVFCLPDCLTLHKNFTREQLLAYKTQFDTVFELMKNELDKEEKNG